MEKQLIAMIGVAVVLGAAVLYLGVEVASLKGRVAELEPPATAQDATAAQGDTTALPTEVRRQRRRARGQLDKSDLRSDEPITRDAIRERRADDLATEGSEVGEEQAERRDRMKDARADRIREQIAGFAEEWSLDDQTRDDVESTLVEFMEHRMEVRRSVMQGDLDRDEARSQTDQMREDVDTRLLDLLGEEALDALREQMPGSGRSSGRRLGM